MNWTIDTPDKCWRLGAWSLVRGGGLWSLLHMGERRLCRVVASTEASRYRLPKPHEARDARLWADAMIATKETLDAS